MKVLVVDDEPLARERLLRLLAKLEPDAELFEAGNGEQALASVALHQPDLLLLDIRMPGMDGLAVARELAQIEQAPAIVFCTAYDRYALEALEQQAMAYLLKPVREADLRSAMDRGSKLNRMQLASLEEGQKTRSHVTSDTHKGVETLPVSEIRCFLAEQKYVRAVGLDNSLLLNETLKELEQEFARQFVRVHRGALVNVDRVKSLRRDDSEGWLVELEGIDEQPAVSRRHLSEVKERLRDR